MLQVPVDAGEVIGVDDLRNTVNKRSPLSIRGDLQSTVVPASDRQKNRSLGFIERLDILNERRLGLHSLGEVHLDRKSTRLNSSHSQISYAVFCLKKKKKKKKKK